MSIKLLAVFALTEFLMSLTPGPAVLLVISQSVRTGFWSSVSGVIGILAGNTLYFVLSAFGLGALLVASGRLFQVLKWAGVIYLMGLGLKMLFSPSRPDEDPSETGSDRRRRSLMPKPAAQGLITQLSNPRAIIFFTALLPQFVTPGGNVTGQLVTLGIVSIAVEFPVLLFYGWAGGAGARLLAKGHFPLFLDRIAGGFLIAAGVTLAATHQP